MKRSARLLALLTLCSPCILSAAHAQEVEEAETVQPYIEKLKRRHGIESRSWKDESLPPVTEAEAAPPAQAREDGDDPAVVQPYLERLRAGHEPAPESDVQPYLESLQAGRELKPRIEKRVGSTAGFALSATSTLGVTSGQTQANSFNSVYGVNDKWVPAADFFYERQFFRDSIAGSFGPVVHIGVISTKGKGVFTRSGNASEDTVFRFIAIPTTLGLSYRLLALRYVVPFVQAGLAVMPFFEERNDGKDTRRSMPHGLATQFGLALNIDWVARRSAWDRYGSYGVVTTYLVAQRQVIHSLASSVDLDFSTTSVGLSFEF